MLINYIPVFCLTARFTFIGHNMIGARLCAVRNIYAHILKAHNHTQLMGGGSLECQGTFTHLHAAIVGCDLYSEFLAYVIE